MREDLDTGARDGNNPRRGRGVGSGAETGVVRGAGDTDDECAEDVEDTDTGVDLLDRTGDRGGGALGLSGDNGNNFRSEVPGERQRLPTAASSREGSLGEHGPETEELALGARNTLVLVENTRVLPVGETKVLALRTGTAVNADTTDDKTNNGEDLDGGLELSTLGTSVALTKMNSVSP